MITHWHKETWGPGRWPPIPKILYAVLVLWALAIVCSLVQLGCQGIGEVESVNPVAGRDSTIITVDVPFGGTRFLLCESALAGDIVPGQWTAYHGAPATVDQHSLIDIDRLRRVFDLHAGREDLSGHRPVAAILGAALLLLGSVLLRLLGGLVLAAIGMTLLWRLLLWLGQAGMIDLSSGPATGAILAATGLAITYAGLRRWHAVNRWMQSLALAAVLSLLARGFASELGWPESVVVIAAGVGPLLSPVVGVWLLSGFFMALGTAMSPAGQLVVMALVFLAMHLLCGGDWFPGRTCGTRVARPHQAANERGEVPLAALLAIETEERS